MSKSQTCVELPVFDISKPLDQYALSSLCQACKEWGFFHITNHGISKDIYNKIYSLSNHIFNLLLELKLKVGPLISRFIASHFFDSFKVCGPYFFTSAQSSAFVLFNQQNLEFGVVLEEYGSKMTELSKRIVEIVLMSLGEIFEKKYYDFEFSKCHGYLRIINYSAPERVKEKQVEGLGIVYQDEKWWDS